MPPHVSSRQSLKLIVLIVLTLALAALLWSHFLLDGSRFHRWAWHRAPVWPVLLLMAVAALPFAVAQIPRLPRPLSLALLMLSLLLMQIVSSMAQDHEVSLMPIARQAQSKLTTSYLFDAEALIERGVSANHLLASYPQHLDSFHLHARSKPPGPILYWYFWLSLLGPTSTAALIGGLFIGVLSTLSLCATYWFINAITFSTVISFASAAKTDGAASSRRRTRERISERRQDAHA